jgi:hypothetical protein
VDMTLENHKFRSVKTLHRTLIPNNKPTVGIKMKCLGIGTIWSEIHYRFILLLLIGDSF